MTGDVFPGALMIGLQGPRLTDREIHYLEHPRVGGVILFDRNIESPAQVRDLNQAIRDAAAGPVMIAVDQEGGRVRRLRNGFSGLPALGTVGRIFEQSAKRGLAMARQHAYLMATEVRAAGFDVSFAPVLDLDRISEVIGDRGFHARPDFVSRLGQAYVAGMHAAGMAATGKHFPGHGSVVPDSHVTLPVDERAEDQIRATDLRPFRDLVTAGLDGIMMAHVIYPCLDQVPASFSPVWIGEILRQALGFNGLVFCDDIAMAAASVMGSAAQAAQAAWAAGCDIVPVCEPAMVPEVMAQVDDHSAGVALAKLNPYLSGPGVDLDALADDAGWVQARDDIKALTDRFAT